MRLRVLLPTEVLLDVETTKIVAEAEDGEFCLLPRHTDYVSALVPGILSFSSADGAESLLATGDGILVKTGPLVRVSVRSAVRGDDLGTLRRTVTEQFLVLDDRERTARSAVARLEADFVRRFLVFGEPGRG